MGHDIGFFAVKSIGMSKISRRKAQTLRGASRHNLREIQAEMGACGGINPLMTPQNRILARPNSKLH
jgi:hypothetical protein